MRIACEAGLDVAVSSEEGYRFSTYATNWIRQAVTRTLEDTSFTIRVPSHIHQPIARASWTEAELTASTGKEPDPE